MPVVNGNERALLVARLGAARLAVSRLGFTPEDTRSGNTSPFYAWTMVRGTPGTEASGADPTWTVVKS